MSDGKLRDCVDFIRDRFNVLCGQVDLSESQEVNEVVDIRPFASLENGGEEYLNTLDRITEFQNVAVNYLRGGDVDGIM